jgi:hypothetical protein
VKVKVDVGTVGVNVGLSVGVFVNVGEGMGVGGAPKNSPTVMEQAESNIAHIRRIEFFFMSR